MRSSTSARGASVIDIAAAMRSAARSGRAERPRSQSAETAKRHGTFADDLGVGQARGAAGKKLGHVERSTPIRRRVRPETGRTATWQAPAVRGRVRPGRVCRGGVLWWTLMIILNIVGNVLRRFGLPTRWFRR